MPESKRVLGSDLAKVDATTDEEIARHMAEDDAPELTQDELAAAEVWEGDRFIRRVGRPQGSGKKELVTLRIDRDVLDHFRATGPGWQTRMNDTLRTITTEGKPTRASEVAAAAARGQREGRRGSKREELLRVIREGHGLTRGEILERMGLKGNKSGEMSVSNALTALTKSSQIRRGEGRKYTPRS